MASNRHHRGNLCERDFETGEQLEPHVERRHPKADVRWWVVAENPEKDLQFTR